MLVRRMAVSNQGHANGSECGAQGAKCDEFFSCAAKTEQRRQLSRAALFLRVAESIIERYVAGARL